MIRAVAAIAKLTGAEKAALGALAAGMVGGSVLVAPRALEGAFGGAAEEAAEIGVISAEHAATAAALSHLLDSCAAVIAVRAGGRGAGGETGAVVLWAEDKGERGVMEAGEVLVLLHSPVLEALVAMTAPEGSSERIAALEAMEAGFPERWRAREDVRKRVVAAGVTAVSVARAEAGEGRAVVRVGLTWGGGSPDEPESAEASASLPALAVARRARR